MMKNKGFTLVELLAVIVILAIIAVIAVPQVLNLIEKSREEAFKASVRNIFKVAELEVVKQTYSGDITSLGLGEGITGYWSYSPDNKTIKVCNVSKGSYTTSSGCITKSKAMEDFSVTHATANLDQSGANRPDLNEGMIPVYYDGTNWVKADVTNTDSNHKWYDYDAQQWANAVTVTSTNRTTHMNAAVGTEIPMTDINTMWVWIPRYKYAIPSGSGAREINVVFENGMPTKADGNAEETDYKTHPAFTFGDDEVAGIWVGKFETTGSIATPTIKPDEISVKSQTLSAMFNATRKMKTAGNPYGFTNDNDTHMMKNSEWGAVAYLSQSKYGKYGNTNYIDTEKEIYINNANNYKTGSSGGRPGYASGYTAEDGCFSYDGIIKKANRACNADGNFSGTVGQKLPPNQLYLAYGASTTGTIYGIYDMAGGSWEYVMGNYNNTIGASTITFPNSKYYNLYTSSTLTTACYGHALSETKSWNSDSAGFEGSSDPWVVRGGGCSSGVGAGAFYYDYNTGGSNGHGSWRSVQVKP